MKDVRLSMAMFLVAKSEKSTGIVFFDFFFLLLFDAFFEDFCEDFFCSIESPLSNKSGRTLGRSPFFRLFSSLLDSSVLTSSEGCFPVPTSSKVSFASLMFPSIGALGVELDFSGFIDDSSGIGVKASFIFCFFLGDGLLAAFPLR